MKRIKKVVDERQELELLRIEHMVFWIVFWLLLASVIVQTMFMDVPFFQVLPEFAIFMVCCVGFLIGAVKKGQWDFYTRPTVKTYVLTSLIGSAVFGILFGISVYVRDPGSWDGHIWLIVLLTGAMIVFLFALIFALSALVGHMVKKKQERLADTYGKDEDDE